MRSALQSHVAQHVAVFWASSIVGSLEPAIVVEVYLGQLYELVYTYKVYEESAQKIL